MFFLRARAKKGIARNTDASSAVWTLIYNGKLANQIARLAAIVVKLYFTLEFRSCLDLFNTPTGLRTCSS